MDSYRRPNAVGESEPAALAVTGASGYRRHRPEHTVLYQLVEQYAGAFFEHLSEQGASLPGFVREEFDDYLRCGRLEEGLLRVKCTGCRHEHAVAFSRRRRGFCPSCGARRMVDGAAHLVDHVLPHVSMRQWVLTSPWPLRLLFAARPALLTRVLGVVTRALSTSVLRRAGLTVRSGAKSGIVTAIQRFGSSSTASRRVTPTPHVSAPFHNQSEPKRARCFSGISPLANTYRPGQIGA